MTYRIRSLCTIPLLAGALLVGACGGGGGGGEPEPTLTITEANAPAVAREVFFGPQDIEFVPLGASAATAAGSGHHMAWMPHYLHESLPLSGMHRGHAGPFAMMDCAGGGSVSGPDDPNARSGMIEFRHCMELGLTFHGAISFSASGDEDDGSLTLTIDNLSITGAPGGPFTIDGRMRTEWSTAGNIETGHESGGFTITSGGRRVTVSHYSMDYRHDEATGLETSSWRHSMASDSLGGRVRVRTMQSFRWLDSDDYPYEGQLRIDGANGTSCLLTVLGSGDGSGLVRLDVDADGDGVFEATQELTWAQLEA
jgi:hypothetical protein